MLTNHISKSLRQNGFAVVLIGAALAAFGCNEQGQSGSAATGGASAEATPKRTTTREITLPAGTVMVASLQNTISTKSNHLGDRVTLRTVEPVQIGGMPAVPVGSTVTGEITHIEDAGRVKGGAELTLRFVELVTTDGKSYPLTSEPFRLATKGDGKESTAEIAGGAAVGGIIGGIAGGGDGALKGAAIGGILGTGVAVATKGDNITLPAGQKIRVVVASPVTMVKPIT
jgi:hypothetical protein